ncbi:hypothetical protein F5878DRAFT_432790 [Lentinula raphanica]|uniref:Secreted protein n=1 Tax=Lentinula raphanica TaxID=153919 RepID=A0AA38UKJ8_9AGAR|nr:hypothetical protein F5878DRAFT_432790 [Lentinula raphanica]
MEVSLIVFSGLLFMFWEAFVSEPRVSNFGVPQHSYRCFCTWSAASSHPLPSHMEDSEKYTKNIVISDFGQAPSSDGLLRLIWQFPYPFGAYTPHAWANKISAESFSSVSTLANSASRT